MIRHISSGRLQKFQSGRGSTRAIISKDWMDLKSMGDEETSELLERPPLAASDFFDMEVISHIQLDNPAIAESLFEEQISEQQTIEQEASQ